MSSTTGSPPRSTLSTQYLMSSPFSGYYSATNDNTQQLASSDHQLKLLKQLHDISGAVIRSTLNEQQAQAVGNKLERIQHAISAPETQTGLTMEDSGLFLDEGEEAKLENAQRVETMAKELKWATSRIHEITNCFNENVTACVGISYELTERQEKNEREIVESNKKLHYTQGRARSLSDRYERMAAEIEEYQTERQQNEAERSDEQKTAQSCINLLIENYRGVQDQLHEKTVVLDFVATKLYREAYYDKWQEVAAEVIKAEEEAVVVRQGFFSRVWGACGDAVVGVLGEIVTAAV